MQFMRKYLEFLIIIYFQWTKILEVFTQYWGRNSEEKGLSDATTPIFLPMWGNLYYSVKK